MPVSFFGLGIFGFSNCEAHVVAVAAADVVVDVFVFFFCSHHRQRIVLAGSVSDNARGKLNE